MGAGVFGLLSVTEFVCRAYRDSGVAVSPMGAAGLHPNLEEARTLARRLAIT